MRRTHGPGIGHSKPTSHCSAELHRVGGRKAARRRRGAAPLSRGRLAQCGQLGGSQLARQSTDAKMGSDARRRQSIGHGLGGYVKVPEDLNMALCCRDLRRRYVE